MTDEPDPEDELFERICAAGRRDAAAFRVASAAARSAAPPEPKVAKRGHPEREAQQAVVKWLRYAGCLVEASFVEQRADSSDPNARARFGAMRKASGATTGWPDLTVVMPNGRTVFVEMKSSVGRLSEAQRGIHAWLEAHGHVVVTGTSIDTVQAALARAGVVISRSAARMKMAAPVEPLL